MVFHVDSLSDFKVLRATTARMFSKRMQEDTSHTLPIYDLPPVRDMFTVIRYLTAAFAAACFHAGQTMSSPFFKGSPVSGRLAVLPFGIVVEPSGRPAWLPVVFTLAWSEFPAIKEIVVSTLLCRLAEVVYQRRHRPGSTVEDFVNDISHTAAGIAGSVVGHSPRAPARSPRRSGDNRARSRYGGSWVL